MLEWIEFRFMLISRRVLKWKRIFEMSLLPSVDSYEDFHISGSVQVILKVLLKHGKGLLVG